MSAGKPVEGERSSARRWYLLGNLIGTEGVPVDTENPGWHHAVVRACFSVSSCAERWRLSGFLTRSSVPPVRRENKRSLRHPCWSDASVRRSSTDHVNTAPRTAAGNRRVRCSFEYVSSIEAVPGTSSFDLSESHCSPSTDNPSVPSDLGVVRPHRNAPTEGLDETSRWLDRGESRRSLFFRTPEHRPSLFRSSKGQPWPG